MGVFNAVRRLTEFMNLSDAAEKIFEMPVKKEEETSEEFEDGLGEAVGIGDLFYIPDNKYASEELFIKIAEELKDYISNSGFYKFLKDFANKEYPLLLDSLIKKLPPKLNINKNDIIKGLGFVDIDSEDVNLSPEDIEFLEKSTDPEYINPKVYSVLMPIVKALHKYWLSRMEDTPSMRGRSVWEEYGFPGSEKYKKDTSKDTLERKELKIPYPKPSEKPSEDFTTEQKSYMERRNREEDYIKENTFKITKKFMRIDPLVMKKDPVKDMGTVRKNIDEGIKKKFIEDNEIREQQGLDPLPLTEEENEIRKEKGLEPLTSLEELLSHQSLGNMYSGESSPYFEEAGMVQWIEGVNTLDPSYVVRTPTYLISKIPAPIEEKKTEDKGKSLLIPKKDVEEEVYPEKTKMIKRKPGKTSKEDIDEELLIHEAIYEILLDLIKEAEEIKPSEAINQGDVEAIDPETGKKMKLTKKNDYVEGLPEGGGPEESEYFDPTTAEALNKLNIVQK